ncbi:MAG: hypothetical protein A3F82_05975 [Deltaproteobacteria bacterium RIFCSPLOWO2_12_FULL_44_12]|nr:MAG: hypothetical protein A2712_01330 [Deltaproteobacteria bacterium RIFCSPHIGHO2_01_FULL_43_49]OGQ15223.1 MAG: hypothetical protein A3D22_04145 [Deltaproteobacteria bacterium RIFCSPHIGHO2_02_FULL_44_53]OGQ27154.1 MAG: hypothetical protein A3D98_01920 [Deltaproteobacteria bacterium RIFCSPHIGHO2_12_FULL_44_21]OGQ31740.1 MAG: hypothetical protein A2979_05305 [Deltaproteobacteria bacterium RIFCSPLOWO2_01_FULL_45_74]OGQ42940.1 MAG: hypothetical protein A3I70_07610 [Deltaproteobacteria bacterium 
MGNANQSITKSWKQTSIGARAAWLKRFQKLLVRRADEVVAAIQSDTKKPTTEALGIELATVLMTADYYRKKSSKFLKRRRAKTHWMFKNKQVWVERVPFGVVGILGPSNLPFSLTIGDAIPALMAGNTVIIKPSEWTPKSAEIGLKLALEAGLPEGALQIVQGGAEVGSKLIEEVDCVFFTGSTAAGKKVAAKAGELLKPCILELGGKAPMIVLEDADIKRAAGACVWGRFAHSGQHCIAVERVYVDQKIEKPFLAEVIKLTQKLTKEELSPLTLPKAPAHLKELLDDAHQKGARIALQGTDQEKGPTILTHVNHSMRVMKEESFGPLLPIMGFDSVEEALRLANESESGLSAMVFTRNRQQGLDLARKMESGNVSINDCMDHFMIMDAPFGGWKNSGLGVRHSQEGLLQFTKSQTIFVHRFPLPFCRRREFWWFPYTKGSLRLLKGLLRFFFG